MKKYLLVMVVALLTGCGGTTPMKYETTKMEIGEAVSLAEEITWSQHRDWRPDGFAVNEKYISWEMGVVSSSRSWASNVANTGFVVGRGSSTYRDAGDRLYYRNIDRVQLYSWERKFRQWYAVGVVERGGGEPRWILRTKSLEDAELFTSAITSIVDFYKNQE